MKRILLAASALLAVAAASSAMADSVNGASATGTAGVTIFTPITVTQTQGLDFGAITSGASGTVAIAQVSGARTVSGGVGAIAVNVGKPAPSRSTVNRTRRSTSWSAPTSPVSPAASRERPWRRTCRWSWPERRRPSTSAAR